MPILHHQLQLNATENECAACCLRSWHFFKPTICLTTSLNNRPHPFAHASTCWCCKAKLDIQHQKHVFLKTCRQLEATRTVSTTHHFNYDSPSDFKSALGESCTS